uniref:Tocopherol cyclase n=1 Tax=Phaseolus vulgaris TaxID=3885 RepID=B2ZSX9_PHAVU|nr:tocopherol cyclase [Phaseolus vulgaris]
MESKFWEPLLFSPTLPLLPCVPLPSLKLRFPSTTPTTRLLAHSSLSDSVPVQNTPQTPPSVKVQPTYSPTPPNRDLRTPHSGYHFDGTSRKFFEGWYFKVSIPERRQSFCFMYSVESPSFRKPLSPLEQVQYGPRFTGVGAQILGADDKYICQYSPESQFFWGSRHELTLGNTFVPNQNSKPPNKELPPQEFNDRVLEGFQVTPLWNQGFIQDDGRSNYVETVKTARWEYSTLPVYGWGDVGSTQKSTAGWLAAFPVFEPHWQICMAAGLSTGWIEWDGERIEFENAPSYSEKNWGGGFPRKWFWVQCNVFEGGSGEIALTAAGGLRQIPGITETFENAALIGIHCDGKFYEFVPWNGIVNWEVTTCGYWFMTADNGKYVKQQQMIQVLHCVLQQQKLALPLLCKIHVFGSLKLQMWERRYDGSKGKIILNVSSNMAALEVGGGPWFDTWKGKTSTPAALRSALELPIDVEAIFNLSSVQTTWPLVNWFCCIPL